MTKKENYVNDSFISRIVKQRKTTCPAILKFFFFLLTRVSTCYTVNPKLYQHTKFTCEAQLKFAMHNKVGR